MTEMIVSGHTSVFSWKTGISQGLLSWLPFVTCQRERTVPLRSLYLGGHEVKWRNDYCRLWKSMMHLSGISFHCWHCVQGTMETNAQLTAEVTDYYIVANTAASGAPQRHITSLDCFYCCFSFIILFLYFCHSLSWMVCFAWVSCGDFCVFVVSCLPICLFAYSFDCFETEFHAAQAFCRLTI